MNVMPSAGADPAIVSAVTEQQLAIALARKTRQVEQAQGDAVVQLIEQAAQLSQTSSENGLDIQI